MQRFGRALGRLIERLVEPEHDVPSVPPHERPPHLPQAPAEPERQPIAELHRFPEPIPEHYRLSDGADAREVIRSIFEHARVIAEREGRELEYEDRTRARDELYPQTQFPHYYGPSADTHKILDAGEDMLHPKMLADGIVPEDFEARRHARAARRARHYDNGAQGVLRLLKKTRDGDRER